MLLPIDEFLFASVADQIVVSHLDKKIRFDVVEPDKIGSKFRSALEKEGMLKDIKGADYIVRFAEKIDAQPTADGEDPEGSEEEDSKEHETTGEAPEETPEDNPEDDSKEEETVEEPEKDAEEDSEDDSADEDSAGSEEDSEEDDGEDDKKKDKVNESTKIQDLTKSMLLPVKGASAKKSTPKASSKTTAKSSPKNCAKKEGKCTKCGKKCAEKKSGKIEEAETQATGDELKLKVQKVVAKTFDMDKDKVELVDVPDCIDGYNVYYFKLTFKDHEGQTEEED
jgi:hypothetical protein